MFTKSGRVFTAVAYRIPVRDIGRNVTTETTAEGAGAPKQYTGEPAADTDAEQKQPLYIEAAGGSSRPV